MAMSKKDFIDLADAIITKKLDHDPVLRAVGIESFADLCQSQNPDFMDNCCKNAECPKCVDLMSSGVEFVCPHQEWVKELQIMSRIRR